MNSLGFRFGVKSLVDDFPFAVNFQQRHIIGEFGGGIIQHDDRDASVAGDLDAFDPAFALCFIRRRFACEPGDCYFGPGAWLDLLPDGRFDASPEGMRYLGFTGREDLTYYPAESLVKEFYSPEAVAEVLAKYT